VIGTRIGPYQILRRLGEGGTGAVYEAVNAELDRRAAIKILRANMSRNAQAVRRFFNARRGQNRRRRILDLACQGMKEEY
jgi:serine/threonine-protein kinase